MGRHFNNINMFIIHSRNRNRKIGNNQFMSDEVQKRFQIFIIGKKCISNTHINFIEYYRIIIN